MKILSSNTEPDLDVKYIENENVLDVR